MSLSKKRIQDQIEIVGEYKIIQVRYSDQIIEDGKVISSSYHRESISPDNEAKAIEHNVKALADIYWTDEIKEAYKKSLETPLV
jgi:predicted transcriptional regulator